MSSVLPSVSTYLGYFTAMLLGFGLAFELPLLLLMLNMVGILSHECFKRWRRVMIFAVFVFAGIASPSPDPLTMLLLAVPCLVLVEIAEVIIWMNDRRRATRQSLYEGLADDELAPLDDDEPVDQHRTDPRCLARCTSAGGPLSDACPPRRSVTPRSAGRARMARSSPPSRRCTTSPSTTSSGGRARR